MTAQILSSELGSLILDTKRKLPELRNAAEKSLAELKALPTTSEAQLNADLSRRPQFIEPFLIACLPKHPRFAATGMSCLQRLAVSSGLPRSRLKEILETAKECAGRGALDVQLKTLQILPALMQNYPEDLRSGLLFMLLETCSILQSSKTSSVNSTAAATLQQLVSAIFERLAIEDRKSLELPTVAEVASNAGLIPVRALAYDASRIFQDICSLTVGSKPQNVQFSPMPERVSLELIETILVGHKAIISSHPEISHIIRTTILPFLIKTFGEKRPFPIVLRIIRLMYLVIRNHLDLFSEDCEAILDLFNHVLDQAEAVSGWKRVLCMEVLRGIFSEPSLVLEIYAKYDMREGGKGTMRVCMAGFVRLASESPSLIGLGQQSTVPIGNYFQRESVGDTSLDPSSMASKAEGTAGVGTAAVPGISNQWSSIRTPCIDQLDKTEPPSLPETYIYSLVLSCLGNLAESLAKFILPLTVLHNGRPKKRRGSLEEELPSSPTSDILGVPVAGAKLKRTQSSKKRMVPSNRAATRDIQIVTSLMDECWPAILATCSTFFNASLDSDHYRALVRLYQKFAQVSGLLRMATPRDAFFTTLGKAAVPPHVLAATFVLSATQSTESPSYLDSAKELLSVESLVNQASALLPDRARRTSLDEGKSVLSSRNLLCLRALLNLAIALGPTLESSWSIVFETLQQADTVMVASSARLRSGAYITGQQHNDNAQFQVIATEVTAVHAATSRLFECTADFPDECFIQVLQALCRFLEVTPKPGKDTKRTPPTTPIGIHRRVSSLSGISVKTDTTAKDYVFALSKIRELVSGNVERFISSPPEESGWNILTSALASIATHSDNPSTSRLLAAEISSRLARDTIAGAAENEDVLREDTRCRALKALLIICNGLGRTAGNESELSMDETSDDVHLLVLETLRAILEQIGDSLFEGWGTIFKIISSVFIPTFPRSSNGTNSTLRQRSSLLSVSLGRSSFASVQLLCSDFLTSVPKSSLLTLVDTIFLFCSQDQDLNISLTTTTLFWNLSDLLYSQTTNDALEQLSHDVKNDSELIGNGLIQELRDIAQKHSMPALWLLLLRRLTDATADAREEVRTGALHTILRIFDNHGEDLSYSAWQLCLRAIVLPLLDADARTILRLLEAEAKSSIAEHGNTEIEGRFTTSRLLLQGTSKLFADYLSSISQCSSFARIWEFLINTFSSYLECQVDDINSAVYSAITTTLSAVPDVGLIGEAASQRMADIWTSQFPKMRSSIRIHSNQDAYESYVRSFKNIYRLNRENITAGTLLKVGMNFERAIRQSDMSSYSTDENSMTALQCQVVESLSLIRTDMKGSPSVLIGLLARFVQLPITSRSDGESSNRSTFIALSKACMDFLKNLVANHATRDEIFNSALLQAIISLEKPITLKYNWTMQGKGTTLWQKATTTLLSLLESTLPRLFEVDLDDRTMHKYWEVIVLAARGIARADVDAAPNSVDDEDFDIESFKKLSSLIIPALGSNRVPDITRRAYTRILFENSLVHAIEREDEGLSDLDSEPLKDIYCIRFGRTLDSEPARRVMMAYQCFGDLISLVSVHDSSPQRMKLAQAASPYLILRGALTLKAYVADQPLRGRYMPQPEKERQELLFVLREMRNLKSESGAIPKAEGLKSEGRRHLVRLYGLVIKAIGVAGGTAIPDAELISEMRKWLESVGEEFKL